MLDQPCIEGIVKYVIVFLSPAIKFKIQQGLSGTGAGTNRPVVAYPGVVCGDGYKGYVFAVDGSRIQFLFDVRFMCIVAGDQDDTLLSADIFAQLEVGNLDMIQGVCPVRICVRPDDNDGILPLPLGSKPIWTHSG